MWWAQVNALAFSKGMCREASEGRTGLIGSGRDASRGVAERFATHPDLHLHYLRTPGHPRDGSQVRQAFAGFSRTQADHSLPLLTGNQVDVHDLAPRCHASAPAMSADQGNGAGGLARSWNPRGRRRASFRTSPAGTPLRSVLELERDRVDRLSVIPPASTPHRRPVRKQRLDPRLLRISQRRRGDGGSRERRPEVVAAAHAGHDLQAVLPDPARVTCLGHRQPRIGASHAALHLAEVDLQIRRPARVSAGRQTAPRPQG